MGIPAYKSFIKSCTDLPRNWAASLAGALLQLVERRQLPMKMLGAGLLDVNIYIYILCFVLCFFPTCFHTLIHDLRRRKPVTFSLHQSTAVALLCHEWGASWFVLPLCPPVAVSLQAMKQKQRAYGNAKFRSVAQVDGVDEDFYSDIYESGPLPRKGKRWEREKAIEFQIQS